MTGYWSTVPPTIFFDFLAAKINGVTSTNCVSAAAACATNQTDKLSENQSACSKPAHQLRVLIQFHSFVPFSKPSAPSACRSEPSSRGALAATIVDLANEDWSLPAFSSASTCARPKHVE